MNMQDGVAEVQVASIPARRSRSSRAVFLTWLRKIHLYVGLWGAVFGLLFGATGILLNHRAIMKIPVQKTVQRTVQMALPSATAFSSPAQLSAWLQQVLQFKPVAPPVMKSQPAQKVIWGELETTQPERWTVNLHRPGGAINAEYFVGNRFVKLDQIDATPIGTLTRLHMSTGVSAFWVLLTDTIAGSLILLSITGLLLWTQLHTVRTLAVLTSVGAMCAGLWFMWSI
ncbi:PepSY-associated TM helix domain-containing protein [Noviherbaspirillum sedimenti]|uniref:Peptidase n=1 Tax=Noviherbaspirillum sedimenti TaxID=2320865 RepID=A0A3A3FVN2_9BURK|nr:PepSY-associated TM helix domain-containing protein [Noviherbaspirillum sedimenti]RJG00253.1 peptidase [Noviherbaspirillum sedimenti]